MPRYIGKIKDKYFEYSTVVDAPVTYLMHLDQFKMYYQEEYGQSSMKQLSGRLDRADRRGTSSMIDNSLEEMLSGNRYGPDETSLSVSEFIERLERETDKANPSK